IQTALDSARPTADAKGVELKAHLSSVPALWANEGRLQQIMWNLLLNGVKFTPKGGRLTITLTSLAGDTVEVRVADTGIGISPEFLPNVFEPFRQADASASRRWWSRFGARYSPPHRRVAWRQHPGRKRRPWARRCVHRNISCSVGPDQWVRSR